LSLYQLQSLGSDDQTGKGDSTMAETTTEAEVPSFEERQASDRKAWASTGGALAGALAMTSCCILPLVLISFGIGGVWIAQLTALYAYKWYTFAFASAFIGYGFWKLHRAEQGECRDGAACTRPKNRRVMKGTLWLATIVTAIAMIFPYVTPYILSF